MTRIYFAGQDNFGNRGCEALIKSSVKIIGEAMAAEFVVPSLSLQRDQAQWRQPNEHVHFTPAQPFPSAMLWWGRLRRRLPLLKRFPPKDTLSAELKQHISHCDALIMTGGDIISLDYGIESLNYWRNVCEHAARAGKKTVLWAGSIGPFSADPVVEDQMRSFLQSFDLITVRETATLEYLQSIGVQGAHLVADPAFCLDKEVKEDSAVNEIFGRGKPVLGFNVSPLIRKFRPTDESRAALDREVVDFVADIARQGEFSVLLIPHVDPLGDALGDNSDWAYMKRIVDALDDQARSAVRLLPRGFNAGELKSVISRCNYFIGARTHATIAALSTEVPTCSIAYSVKAKGINRDLFGSTKYVLETPDLTAEQLRAHFELLKQDGAEIKQRLRERLPTWRQNARLSATLLARTLEASA